MASLKKNRVALVRCDDYTQKSVNKAVERGIELIGGTAVLVKSGEKILLKPNLLTGVPPEKCVTTHPAVFTAVATVLQSAGVVLSYGDSPATDKPEKAARISGIAAAAEKMGISMADFSQGRNVFYEGGLQPRSFLIAEALFNCDGLVSLPKLKTHGLEKLTLCVKNQFGCIPGLNKAEFHVKLPDAMDFAAFLLDLNKYISPRLYVIDGIEGMEGNGPHGGTPRKMNFLLFATDPIVADAVICRIVGLNPALLPTVILSEDYANKLAEIELVGDPVEDFICSDFKMDRGGPFSLKLLRHASFLRPFLLSRPVIKKELCIKCGKCAEICPVKPKAIALPEGDFPLYDYGRCIRCYCCQEICPKKAIELQKPLLRRLFF